MPQVAFSFGKIEPHLVVLPLFGATKGGLPQEFLGTGFIAGSQRRLITAHHVVKDWEGPLVAVLTPQNHPIRLSEVRHDDDLDLAVFDFQRYAPTSWFILAEDRELHENYHVVCPEYGTTRKIGGEIEISMATRVGNITRRFDKHHFLGKAGEGALELSFPALRGASGAPVLSSQDMKVWGMLTANVAYHLIPAQIETIVDSDTHVAEQVQFMLPQALAIHVKHLRAMLAE